VLFDLHRLPATAAAAFAALPGRFEAVTGDVAEPGAIQAVVAAHGVRRLLHAAAITADANRDAREPVRIATVNLIGTLRALEAARDGGVARYVHASTGALFGPAGIGVARPLDEERDRPDPQSLYGITKFAAERACLRLASLWRLDVRIGRLAQVYGRWEYPSGERDTLSLPCQLTAVALRGGEAVIPQAGPQDWIYAPDVAAALIALLDAGPSERALYHLGNEAPFAVEAWCERLAARFPAFRWRFAAAGEAPNVTALSPQPRTAFSSRRLRADTGWAPRFPIDAAFADYMTWIEAGGAGLIA
jgi:UDP-glucuronate 4-epimerase